LDPSVGQVVRHEAAAAGEVGTQRVTRAAPDVPGNYLLYYNQLRDYLAGQGPLHVTPEQVRQVMAVLTVGEQSAREGRFLAL
jgi:hypothetical protein